MAIIFPPSPTLNDVFTAGDRQWKWNGTSWQSIVAGESDPTMGGDLSGTASTAQIAANAVGSSEIAAGAVGGTEIASTFDISSKTVTLPAASVTAHVTQFDDNQLKEEIALLGFRTAANGSLAKYNLVDQTIDAFEDASGIDASASTDELRNASNYYSGIAAGSPTGGTITTYTGYTVHSFTSTGNTDFVVPGSANVDLLLVAGAGGGGGGSSGGGNGGGAGGGAGGVRALASQAVTAQTYVVTVGTGGAGGSGYANGSVGVDSSALGLSASGGGYGGKWNHPGGPGGSGGGATNSNTGGAGNAGSYTPVEGYAGANSIGDVGGAGGGGASEVGFPNTSGGTSGNRGGPGGDGISNSWRTNSAVTYGGGGGGGSGNYGPGGGPGGTGGGASGGGWNGSGDDGTDGLGGGGGGGSYNSSVDNSGGDGGDGIVVIRWADGAFNTYNDMTLISNATTAEAVPTKGDLVMTYSNGAGTATVNTDLKAYASRDDGTTWTQLTLASQGSTGAHTILSAHDLDISGQPSGTDMRYKITTHNQSVTKQTRIHAVSLGWS